MLYNGFKNITQKIIYFWFIFITIVGFLNNYFYKTGSVHHANDSLVLLYFLFTSTSSTYILISLFIFWYLNLSTLININLMIKLIIILLLLNYYIDNNNYFFYVIFFIKKNIVNTNLQNGILNIHPILIYIIYVFVLLLIYMLYIRRNHKLTLIKIATNVYNILFYVITGVLLGAF